MNKQHINECLRKISITDIISYAQKTYPNEACGFITENGSIYPAHNVISMLGDASLTAENAFLIDNNSWKIAASHGIVGIYHSHTNGNPEMSGADQEYLRWRDLFYVIIGLIDHNPIAAKIFWWENSELCSMNINL